MVAEIWLLGGSEGIDGGLVGSKSPTVFRLTPAWWWHLVARLSPTISMAELEVAFGHGRGVRPWRSSRWRSAMAFGHGRRVMNLD
ncbi:hypothetical protein M6B38_306295 [Iris pallida]|uniref:Uncharacterized protein n=1 Tax=Iris pallida TaxID=29817 RepID=A0AAX6HL34_IRIPA|nr:hypothetical protein M6B38_306295 [Iris pallida]